MACGRQDAYIQKRCTSFLLQYPLGVFLNLDCDAVPVDKRKNGITVFEYSAAANDNTVFYGSQHHRHLEYANEAQNEIARAIYLKAEENILPENGIFPLSELSRFCRQVLAVQQLGHEVRFLVGKEDRIIALPYATPAIITYLCYPKPLEWLYEEPELPSYTHGLIANYIIGMVLKGSRPGKDTPNIHLSIYEAAIRTLKKKEQVCRLILKPERNSEEP